MRRNLRITAEVDAGASIYDTAKEAIGLASRIKVTVEFQFNSVTCVANPGGSAEKLASEYQEKVISDSKYKLAFA